MNTTGCTILVVDRHNARLCEDGKFRKFATFGTAKSCVKLYKGVVSAQRTAAKRGAYVAVIPADKLVDASGRIHLQDPASGPLCFKAYTVLNYVSFAYKFDLSEEFPGLDELELFTLAARLEDEYPYLVLHPTREHTFLHNTPLPKKDKDIIALYANDLSGSSLLAKV